MILSTEEQAGVSCVALGYMLKEEHIPRCQSVCDEQNEVCHVGHRGAGVAQFFMSLHFGKEHKKNIKGTLLGQITPSLTGQRVHLVQRAVSNLMSLNSPQTRYVGKLVRAHGNLNIMGVNSKHKIMECLHWGCELLGGRMSYRITTLWNSQHYEKVHGGTFPKKGE